MIFEIGDGYVYKKIVSPASMYFIRQKVAAKFMIAILILLISVKHMVTGSHKHVKRLNN